MLYACDREQRKYNHLSPNILVSNVFYLCVPTIVVVVITLRTIYFFFFCSFHNII